MARYLADEKKYSWNVQLIDRDNPDYCTWETCEYDWETISNYIDQDLGDQINCASEWETDLEYFNLYLAAHKKKHSTDFYIN